MEGIMEEKDSTYTHDFTVSQDEYGIYHLHGELTILQAGRLRSFLNEAADGGRDVRVSLSNLSFLDITTLQLFIAFKNSLYPQRQLQLVGVSPEVENILRISGLKNSLIS